jgi:hypothetical protein
VGGPGGSEVAGPVRTLRSADPEPGASATGWLHRAGGARTGSGPGRAPPMDTYRDVICKGIVITGAFLLVPAARP